MLASTYFPGQLPAKYRKRRASLTSVFGMGTGGPSPQSTPTFFVCLTDSLVIITPLYRFVKHFFKKFSKKSKKLNQILFFIDWNLSVFLFKLCNTPFKVLLNLFVCASSLRLGNISKFFK